MKARIELQISSETDLSVRDIVDLMHDALDSTHGIKIAGIVVDKDEVKEQILNENEKKEKAPSPEPVPEQKYGKYGPGTVVADDGMGQPDSVEEFPPNNNLKAVPVNKKERDKHKGNWNFGTKWL
ncbi:hypothetical protein H8E06_00805 [bacterium]|nr:hypothetical protein [bacterium]